jgi:carboxypeptidase C (cathepsin A)
VLVQQGYFDLATPYGATRYFIDHLDVAPAIRDNLELKLYEAGHMMYVHPTSMAAFKADLAAFMSD